MTNRKHNLSSPSTLFRSTVAKTSTTPAVDRDGGDQGAGLIRGVAIITRGEALGHGVWIDREFLHQSADAINAADRGLKSRFTHPGLSGDGMGKYLGRVRGASVDGDVVRGDLHISKTAHETPDGNLAEYVMDLAEIEPDMFGLSIVFSSDPETEREHAANNETSPDPANAANLPHARLADIRAVDVVDEPAANPSGLFHRGDEIAGEADRLLSFALGLTSDAPRLSQFDIDPGRVAGFVARFLSRHGLEITKRTTEMDEQNTVAEVVEETETTTDEVVADETTTDDDCGGCDDCDPTDVIDAIDEDAETVETETAETVEASTVPDGQQFLDAFGDQGGVWFAEGKSFDDARELYVAGLESEVAKLRADNERMRADLSAGEDTPLSFGGEADGEAEDISADARRMGRAAAVLRRAVRINNNN